MNKIKINNAWRDISNIYVKQNNSWVLNNTYDLSAHVYFFEDIEHSIILLIMSTIVGEETQVNVKYDYYQLNDLTNVTFSITSGNAYASIDSSGLLTILPGANNSSVTILATYDGLTDEKTIAVTYQSGTSTETTINDDGTTTETIVTDNGDGSTTSSSTTLNENGDIVETDTITTNEDGSSTEVNIVYNEDGSQTQNTIDTDTSNNVVTETVEIDEYGNEEITGYNIDTTNNENGGLAINDGIDTGILAFNGRPFTIHLKAKFDVNGNTGNPIICAAQKVENTSKYAGFELLIYSVSLLNLYATNQGTYNTSTGVLGSKLTTYRTKTDTSEALMRYLKTGTKEYTIDIQYIPTDNINETSKQILLNIYPLYTSISSSTINNGAFVTKSVSNIPDSLPNATISIGEFNGNDSHKMTGLEILEFSVQKG